MSGSRFFSALAAMLFTAASAWTGAALLGPLAAPRFAVAETAALRCGARLDGLVLRRETALDPASVPAGARDGQRLGAAETGGESALFFSDCDGWEGLAAEGALSPEALDALLAVRAGTPGRCGRLVYGWDWYYAAFLEEADFVPEPGVCRVLFDGTEEELEAQLVSARTDADGRTALLLRFTSGGRACYSLRRAGARLLSEERRGLAVPAAALHRSESGETFVYILSGGTLSARAAELLYRGGELCLLRGQEGDGALRPGDRVLLGTPGTYQEKERDMHADR